MEPDLKNKANQFDEKIKTTAQQFFSVLGDYRKYYVYYNKNPEVSEFENFYSESKGQLQTMSNNVVSITNNINQVIDVLDAKMSIVSDELEKEKEINMRLMKLAKNLENTQNGSEILIDDAKDTYNRQYYYNVELFIGILISAGIIFKFFKSPPAPSA
jgi:hypothetical protein